MTYRGYVRGGVVVLANGAALPEGAEVRVEVVGAQAAWAQAGDSLYDRYSAFIALIDDLPADFAAQHDHYIHGTPPAGPMPATPAPASTPNRTPTNQVFPSSG